MEQMADPASRFQAVLHDYAARLRESASSDARKAIFIAWAWGVFGIDFDRVEDEKQVYKGRVDALLGDLVFQFTQDSEKEERDAEAQLLRHISHLLARHRGATYTGVITDGTALQGLHARLREHLLGPAPDHRRAGPGAGARSLKRFSSGWTLCHPTSEKESQSPRSVAYWRG